MTALLDLAAEVFVADGFQGASINVVAERAGASKASLYSRFPTKEALFLAVIEHKTNQIFDTVAASISKDASMRDALLAFSKKLLESALSDSQISLLRVISMETLRFPEIGQRFFDRGPKRGLAVLTRYFREQIAQGTLSETDPRMMAQHFLGLIAGPLLLQRLLVTAADARGDRRQTRYLKHAVDAFLRAYVS